ncbi:MAG: DNA-directed RNA polymerase subunit omega [Candidatus Abyssobacteria bacterium SURF_5]|uniref:DNA-directed RNA polymerase subunit omega n=1 Tax=Abyssobacteria bacterium (strain SURF_5) TaxID=2093360 RepID=A0A3A4N8E8_ABYX5|nr:MAG: DNA-directed RNA polymerase subunit omega [Candidatus Abyssubacteria bacterium SURF_5]
MFKISSEKLLQACGGQYRLLEMAFQRMHQLNNGMPPLVKPASKKNSTIALQEIAEGKVWIADKKAKPDEEAG